jgi:hypothetical protein
MDEPLDGCLFVVGCCHVKQRPIKFVEEGLTLASELTDGSHPIGSAVLVAGTGRIRSPLRERLTVLGGEPNSSCGVSPDWVDAAHSHTGFIARAKMATATNPANAHFIFL